MSFVMRLNSFMIIVKSFHEEKLSKNCARFSKHLLSFLPETFNHDDEEQCDNGVHGPPHHGPNHQNRQQAYNNYNSEDKKYA